MIPLLLMTLEQGCTSEFAFLSLLRVYRVLQLVTAASDCCQIGVGVDLGA